VKSPSLKESNKQQLILIKLYISGKEILLLRTQKEREVVVSAINKQPQKRKRECQKSLPVKKKRGITVVIYLHLKNRFFASLGERKGKASLRHLRCGQRGGGGLSKASTLSHKKKKDVMLSPNFGDQRERNVEGMGKGKGGSTLPRRSPVGASARKGRREVPFRLREKIKIAMW